MSCFAYILVGPTAVGKTDVAHHIAREQDWDILSADALLVYAGMDIGTAKPTPDERAGLTYGGLDLTPPDQAYSVGLYREQAAHYLRERAALGRTVLVAGGTGLYVKALTHGLDEQPATDSNDRMELENLFQQQGLAALQEQCQREAPEAYGRLRDPGNPRRLMRCIEIARQGGGTERTLWEQGDPGVLAGLDMPRPLLNERIRMRVERMYQNGLLDEAAHLEESYGELSSTARMAIGYREAFNVRHGHTSLDEAKKETAQRTRRYARRQITWFKNQFTVDWIQRDETTTTPQLAEQVLSVWRKHGPCRLSI